MKIIFVLIIFLSVKSKLYSQEDFPDLILGTWKNYKTISPINSSTESKGEDSNWIFEKDSLKIENNSISYKIDNDSEFIFMKTKSNEIKLHIIKFSKDSLNLCHKNKYVGNTCIFLKRVSSTE